MSHVRQPQNHWDIPACLNCESFNQSWAVFPIPHMSRSPPQRKILTSKRTDHFRHDITQSAFKEIKRSNFSTPLITIQSIEQYDPTIIGLCIAVGISFAVMKEVLHYSGLLIQHEDLLSQLILWFAAVTMHDMIMMMMTHDQPSMMPCFCMGMTHHLALNVICICSVLNSLLYSRNI